MFDHVEVLTSAEVVDPFEGIDVGDADGEWDVDGGYLGDVMTERTPALREWGRPRSVAETDAASQVLSPASRPQSIEQLQARIRQMQGTKLDTRDLPTHPAIASLLPGGGLKQGAAYSVERSATLLMALLAGPSAAGSWCGVVGVPEFGVEAAASYGIDLDRLVLVPHPGDQWLGVTAAIADVLTVVVTRPPKHASDGSVARLAARLRQRGSTLIVLGTWPQTEAMLSISRSRWSGIGDGFGHLASREVTVTVSSRTSGRPRSADLLLPDDLRNGRLITPPIARQFSSAPQLMPAPQPTPALQHTPAPVPTSTSQPTPAPEPRSTPQNPPPSPTLYPVATFEEAMAG